MADRGSDPDDWFAELEAPPQTSADEAPEQTVEDDWLAEPLPSELGRRIPRVWIAIGAGAVLLAGGLAAAAVLSGGRSPAKPATAITRQTTTAATTTTTTAAHVAVPATTLKPGDTGPQVLLLQRALATLGYAPGTVDGNYGPSTQAAVSAFQRASGLKVDGLFGTATRDALTRRAGG
jgi:hypothetical protein